MTVCYDEGILEAYLDQELADNISKNIEEHLKLCPECRSLLAQLAEERTFSDSQTGAYFAALQGDQAKAWSSLEEFLPQEKNKEQTRGVIYMASKYRKAVAAGAAILVIGVGLTFAPVRTFAANLLNIFRINQVQTVSLTTDDLNKLQQTLSSGAGNVSLGDLGKIEMTKKGESGPVTPAQVQQTLGAKLLLPAKLPAGYAKPETTESAGGTINFTLNTTKTNAVLKDFGATTLLPDSLNRKTFTATLPNMIQTTYQGGANPLIVAEAQSPELTAPEGTDIEAIRSALLALPFLPDDLRQQLSAIDDWQHTLIIPSLDGSSQNVTVAGSQGVYVSASDGVNNGISKARTALVWQKDGLVYGIMGNFSVSEGLDMANSMQ